VPRRVEAAPALCVLALGLHRVHDKVERFAASPDTSRFLVHLGKVWLSTSEFVPFLLD
jgi:hypothetical protein